MSHRRPIGCGLGLQSLPASLPGPALLVPIQHGYYYSLPAWSWTAIQIGFYGYGAGAPRIMTIDATGGAHAIKTILNRSPAGGEPLLAHPHAVARRRVRL